MPKLSIRDLDLNGKRVFMRVDFNVPIKEGKIKDDTRITAALPSIKYVLENGASLVLLSHLGRPGGVGYEAEFSLKPVADYLAKLLGKPVAFAADCVGDAVVAQAKALKAGEVLVCENTRFHKEEEKNDPAFVKALAENGDVWVNDAFSAAHRAHCSTEGLARVLPAFAGRAMQAELEALEKGLGSPAKPVIAIVGGAKVSTKIDLLMNLVRKVDALVIGGGMANTFLAARGTDVGKSLCEHDLAGTAKQIMIEAAEAGCALILPSDGVVAREFKAGAASEAVAIADVPADAMILDVGPKTVEAVNQWIDRAATLVWNGPLGAFEIAPFDAATVAAAKHAAARTKEGKLVSVAGGGDTVAALNHAGVADAFTYVSTAGGAFLEWMEGKPLPGVDVLKA